MKAQMFNHSRWVEDTDPEHLRQAYRTRLLLAGFTILEFVEHYFPVQGYTAIFLLGESHLAIHTFPEEGRTYIELSSCVERQYRSFMEGLTHA